MKPTAALLLLVLPCGPFAAATETAKPDAATEVLPAINVKGEAKCSFGLALTVIREPVKRTVVRLIIAEVFPGSSAANFGLKPGDEILAINGEKVLGMAGEFQRGSKLFKLLIDRPPGEAIDVDIKGEKPRRLTLKAVQRSLRDEIGERTSVQR